MQQSYGSSFSSGYPINAYAPAYYGTETIAPDETDAGVYEAAPEQQSPPPAAPDTRATEPRGQPDVLVRDVQRELASRGYFAGKVNGVVSDGFWESLRRFQTDQRLTTTGLLNQATLFALGLN